MIRRPLGARVARLMQNCRGTLFKGSRIFHVCAAAQPLHLPSTSPLDIAMEQVVGQMLVWA